jgi:hypothetical protein
LPGLPDLAAVVGGSSRLILRFAAAKIDDKTQGFSTISTKIDEKHNVFQ